MGNRLTLCADKAVYLGDMPATGWHAHAAPVLLLGLSGRFALHLADGRTTTCHSALVNAGVEHRFDPQGEQVALAYLEPDAPEVAGLRRQFAAAGAVLVDPVGAARAQGPLAQRLQTFDLAALLGPMVAPAPGLDARVMAGLRALRAAPERAPDRAALAAAVRLSPSRFNHLFSAETGVSFRHYRVWSQVRRAIAGYRPDGRLTDAALDGAFADSAHFSRMFRGTFGMTPSSVLRPLREVRRLD